MQTNANLNRSSVGELIDGVFESGNPEVYRRDTKPGENIHKFASAYEANSFIDADIMTRRLLVGFAIWYPESRGYVYKRSAGLDTKKGKEHASLYAIKGWGIIVLQLNLESLPLINCCISCNSKKKTETWFNNHRALKNPNLWDWEEVERHCSRLMRFADELEKKLAQSGVLQDMLQL